MNLVDVRLHYDKQRTDGASSMQIFSGTAFRIQVCKAKLTISNIEL